MISKIFASILAFWMLASSSWLPLHMHFCMDELAEISILSETEVCPKENQKFNCHEVITQKNKDCCDDHTTYLKSDNELTFSVYKLLEFAADFEIILPKFFFIKEVYSTQSAYSLHPNPPPLIATAPALSLLQSFLL
ncbi:MAG: HYC_CC_PP family protein [Candidatus Cyclobacteriaceae bacterium M2_1C_046]